MISKHKKEFYVILGLVFIVIISVSIIFFIPQSTFNVNNDIVQSSNTQSSGLSVSGGVVTTFADGSVDIIPNTGTISTPLIKQSLTDSKNRLYNTAKITVYPTFTTIPNSHIKGSGYLYLNWNGENIYPNGVQFNVDGVTNDQGTLQISLLGVSGVSTGIPVQFIDNISPVIGLNQLRVSVANINIQSVVGNTQTNYQQYAQVPIYTLSLLRDPNTFALSETTQSGAGTIVPRLANGVSVCSFSSESQNFGVQSPHIIIGSSQLLDVSNGVIFNISGVVPSQPVVGFDQYVCSSIQGLGNSQQYTLTVNSPNQFITTFTTPPVDAQNTSYEYLYACHKFNTDQIPSCSFSVRTGVLGK